MKALGRHKLLFSGALLSALFFGLLFWVNYAKIDATLIGVFRELLTLPMLALLPILLFFSLRSWRKTAWSFSSLDVFSVGILLVTIVTLLVASV